MSVTVGQVCRSDPQSDVYGGQYKIIRRIERDLYEIEYLPADDQTTEAIFDYWASVEANPGSGFTSPVWDKTWAQCAEGARPPIIRWKTPAEMLEEDLAHYAQRAGAGDDPAQRADAAFLLALAQRVEVHRQQAGEEF